MNVPIDTLAFAEKFESAGFAHDQARALAAAFGQAQEAGRADLVTTGYLDLRLSEFEGRFGKQLAEMDGRVSKQLAGIEVRFGKQLADMDGRFSNQLADFGATFNKQLAGFEVTFNKQLGELKVRLTRHVGEVGKDISNRLWSTIAIIAGVSTAISATIGAAVALILKWGGI